jgi:ParB family chromosome partitioning protein
VVLKQHLTYIKMPSNHPKETVEQIVYIPLNELHISPLNQRRNDTSSVAELRALIRSQGLLQNLIVVPEADGGWGVVGGGRRMRAMQEEASDGHFAADHPVPCIIATPATAPAMSLAENSGREPMNPAQEFRAFAELHKQGKPVEDIAAQFGVSPIVVRRRLALSNVHPTLIKAYEAGEMNLETLQAFTLASSHKQQLAAWQSVPQYQRGAHWIRQALTKGQKDARHDRASQFVGLAAYEAAGGAVVRDLFSGENSGYIGDAMLMQKLAAEKLEAEADKVRAEGWAFVDVHPELEWKHTDRFGRSKPATRELTADEQAEISALEAEIETLNAQLHDDEEEFTDGDAETIEDEIGRRQARIETIRAATSTYTDRQKKKAGVVMGIGHGGRLEIHRGMIRPVDPKEAKKKELAKAKAAAEAAGEAAPMGLSEALTRKLTAHRSAALAAHLLECPRVALDLLAANMAMQVLYNGGYYGAAGVHVQAHKQMGTLISAGPDVEESKAYKAIDEQRDALLDLLPEDPKTLFVWLGEQNIMTVVEILCFCTAATLNAVVGNQHSKPLEQLEGTIGLNMADWWQPTRKSFLDQVPKQVILDALKEVGFDDAAIATAEKLKKSDLAAYAEEALADSGWVPAPIRGKASPIVAEARKPKAKAATRKPVTSSAKKPVTNSAKPPVKSSMRKRKGEMENAPPEKGSMADQFHKLNPAAAWPFPINK